MTPVQFMVISWIPHFTGTLSFIGSLGITYLILSDREYKLTKPNHRLMLSMSAFDVLSSAALASSTWSFGNMTTCKIQYFFVTLGLAVPMYNASLSLLYLLTIRYRLHQRHFATKIEPYLHAASVLVPLIIATVPIVMDAPMNTKGYGVCSIYPDSPMAWPLCLVPLLSFCVCLYSMTSISCYVQAQSKRMGKYSYGMRQTQRRESEKRATIRQAIFYTAAFFITFIFQAMRMLSCKSFPVEIMNSVFFPLQGFWNFLLYIRPNVMKMKEAKPDKCLCEIIWSVVFHSRKNNTEVRPKQRKNENKHRIELKQLQASLDEDTGVPRNHNCEDTKEDICNNLPGPNALGQSCVYTTGESDNEGSSPIIKSGINDESGEIRVVPQTSLVFATPGDDICSSDGSIERCVIRRASLIFASAADDISFHSLDSQETI